MAGWIHTVLFGGDGDEVKQLLDESYGGNAVYNATTNEEMSRIDLVSERGWGHAQTSIMSEAAMNGHVSWWSRHSQPN